MNFPSWVTDDSLDTAERRRRELAYRLRLAALHHNPGGSLTELSRASGLYFNHLTVCIGRGRVSRKVALAVQAVVGKDVFSAETCAENAAGAQ